MNFEETLGDPINYNVRQNFEHYSTFGEVYRFEVSITANGNDEKVIKVNSSVLVPTTIECYQEPDESIDGLIGLGYFNQFSDDLIQANHTSRSFTAYQITKGGDMLFNFGNMTTKA